MRKALLIPLILLAVFGCKKLGNPLNPDTNLPLGTGAGNLPVVTWVEPAAQTQLLDDEPGTSGIQATVVVTFSDYMDPDSVVRSATVKNTSTGQVVAGLAVSYAADARKLYVRHVDWTANAAYLLILGSSGAKNRWGTAIDGNRNGKADGSPYDDALTTFYPAGSSSESCVGTTPPAVDWVSPDTERITDTLTPVTVRFTGDMDTTTLVPASFTLVSETGSSVQLKPAGKTKRSVSFTLGSPLRLGRRYDLTILSSAVKGKGLANTPSYLLNLDADGDGAEATEQDFKLYFRCDTLAPPEVHAWDSEDRVEFDFSSDMDATTLTPENIRAFDETGYVPGSLVVTSDAPGGFTRVYYYFSRPSDGSLRAFVSRAVMSLGGVQLDGSGNGIGGEPWDDFWGWP